MWNLLPVIGEEFEKKGNPPKFDINPNEDVEMAQNSQNSAQSQNDDEGSDLDSDEMNSE